MPYSGLESGGSFIYCVFELLVLVFMQKVSKSLCWLQNQAIVLQTIRESLKNTTLLLHATCQRATQETCSWGDLKISNN